MKRFLFLLLAGCTPQGSTSTPPPPPDAAVNVDAGPPSPTDYCELTADAYCAFYVRCGRMAVSTEEACRSVFLESCNNRYERIYASLAAQGFMELSGEGIAACSAHLRTVGCEQQVQDLDGPCGLMWRGLQPEGQPCGLGIESLVCADGTKCVLGLDFCGECKAFVDDGAACGDGITCANASACVNGVCTARPRAGDACSSEIPCVVGTSCMGSVCTGPSYAGLGEACDAARRCPYKAVCSGGMCREQALLDESCSGAGTCATGFCGMSGACEVLKEPGAPCSSGTECVSGACAEGSCMGIPGACFSSR